jgi:lysophospholipase L1-like esterase
MWFVLDRIPYRRLLFCTLLLVTIASGCSSPSAPTPPPPPPPPPEAPTLTCSESIARGTIDAGGLAVSYPAPEVRGGQNPVNVTCSPESGATFPIGQTAVTCTATDGLQREARCTFGITISRLAQVSRVRYMAFGDSITAGEVTFPVSTSSAPLISKQVLVPSASYPTVLQRLLRTRYQFQADQIVVNNAGVGGEKAIDARNRFFAVLNSTRPEVVLILSGHNDIPRGDDGAASGAANEVRIMAAGARSAGARVFIGTPVPGRPGGNRTIDPFLLEDYAGRMRHVAAQEGAVLVDLYALMRNDVFRYIGVDGLHPNEAGYARIAELFFEAIGRELEVR